MTSTEKPYKINIKFLIRMMMLKRERGNLLTKTGGTKKHLRTNASTGKYVYYLQNENFQTQSKRSYRCVTFFYCPYILISVLGCSPAAKIDTASVTKNETRCAELGASYKTAQNRKAEIETRTAEKQSLDIEEAIFSWPSMLAKKIDEISPDANVYASKKMREKMSPEKTRNGQGKIARVFSMKTRLARRSSISQLFQLFADCRLLSDLAQ